MYYNPLMQEEGYACNIQQSAEIISKPNWSALHLFANLSSQVFNFVVSVIDKFGYSGIFILMAMESATLPVPSEVVLPIAGYLTFLGHMNFWFAVMVASAGSLLGTLIDYYIGHNLGRPVILKYGSYFKINKKHLATSEKWLDKFGEVTVFLARFVPLIRTLVAFPAGIAGMKIWKFLVFSFVGIFVWDAVLIYLGLITGRNSAQIISVLSRDFSLVGVVALVVVILSIILLVERRRGAKEQGIVKQPSFMPRAS